jgi:hypothetical protein
MANPRIEVEIGAKTDKLKSGLGGAKTEVQNFSKEVEKSGKISVKSTDQMSTAFAGVGKVIAGAFAADALLGFGKAILDTTAEFQKFEAVLTNTLGSNSAAKGALSLIVDFASKTPFQVNELTESFVKLANRGFIPNIKQLTQLGDLAASTGKSFDQLTEAILDAQTGEFERLKEFGIRASQSGDQVAFTFKGVTVEVEKTDTAIQNYILGLGDLEGVSGGMAAISETVGGKLSNLGDNFDRLKLALGSQSSGLIASVLDASNALVDGFATALSAVNTVAEKTGQGGLQSFLNSISAVFNPVYAESIKLQAKAFQQLDKNALEAATSVDAVVDPIKELEKAQKLAAENQEKYKKALSEYSKSWDEFNKNFGKDAQSEIDAYNEGLERTAEIASKLESLSVNLLTKIQEPAKKQESQNKLNDTDFLAGVSLPTIEVPEIDDSNLSKFVVRLAEFNSQVANVIQNGAQNTLGDFAFSIGDALATGGNVLKAAGASLLSGLAGILNQLGQLAIGAGLAIGGIKKALTTLNPAVAIAAGVALVGLAGFVSAKAKSLGGGGGGGGGSSVGSSVASQSFSGGGVSGLGGGVRDLTGELVVRGTDLVYVLGQSNNKIAKG